MGSFSFSRFIKTKQFKMGQGFGLPTPHSNAKIFSNCKETFAFAFYEFSPAFDPFCCCVYGTISFSVSREAIESLWTSYNLFGEGWGLDFYSMTSIFKGAVYLVNNVGKNLAEYL